MQTASCPHGGLATLTVTPPGAVVGKPQRGAEVGGFLGNSTPHLGDEVNLRIEKRELPRRFSGPLHHRTALLRAKGPRGRLAGGASHALDGKGLGMEFRGRCVWSTVRQVGRCPGREQSEAGGAADRSPRLPGIEAPRWRLGTGGWGALGAWPCEQGAAGGRT